MSQLNDGLEPGVGFYVDQVYHARPATAAFDFADIAQVEELRGPQGTLFGENTTAGAINMTTRAPTFTTEGFAELSYGDYDFLQANGWVSGPISDTVAYRVSGVSTRRNGVFENTPLSARPTRWARRRYAGNRCSSPMTLCKCERSPTSRIFQSYCCAQDFMRVGQSRRAANRQYPALAQSFGYAPPSTEIDDRRIDIDGPLGVDTNEGGLSAITDWNTGLGTITSVTAWRFWRWDAENDRDYTGLPIQL